MALADERRAPYTMHYARAAKHYVVRCRATGAIVFRNPMKALAERYRDRMNRREAPVCDREFVSTKAVRRHIESLRAKGIGTRVIAKRAGINRSVLARIIDGEIERTRKETVQKILGVALTPADGARVDARSTWELLEVIFAAGYRKGAIARMLGRKTRALQIREDVILRSTQMEVEKLYAALWLKDAKVRAIAPQAPKGVVLPPVDAAAAARKKLRAMDVDAFAEGLSRLLAS